MPWSSVRKPALSMALLKSCVRNAGHHADLHLLNIRFAERIGLHLYESIIDRGSFLPEWFFAQQLFGPSGLGEIANSWQDLCSVPANHGLRDEVRVVAENSAELCERIASEHVPRFIDDCVTRVAWERYQVVGFTTTFAQSLSSLLLARRIKEKFPAVKIIFGGANVDDEMGVEFMKGFEWIDYVVHGEAEKSLPSLLSNISSGRPHDRVPGVTMRTDSAVIPGDKDPKPLINMNEAPVPDYSDYIRELERTGFARKFDVRLWFESSRGCWWGAKHHCTFCGLNATEMSFRKKDPARVYSELRHLSESYHCLSFCATDSILALEYFNQLLPKISEMQADLHFFYEVKANLNREQIRKLAAAGIREIQPGIESFNSRLLRLMRKGVTAIQNIQLLKWCLEEGITPSYNILYGFPGETPEDYRDFPDLCRMLAHLIPPDNIGPVIFERFSPYHYESQKFGLTLKPIDLYRFLFPENRVALEKIAYCFQGEWEGQEGDPNEYAQPAVEAVRSWRAQWNQRPSFCYYAQGPNYLMVYDSRPRRDGSQRVRQLLLNEEVSAIYKFCDENRSLQSIQEMMRTRFQGRATVEQVQAWLDHLVHEELMFEEGQRYLALAVHKIPAPQGRPLRPGQFGIELGARLEEFYDGQLDRTRVD
jgi:ribosomal peptide maturation radical SAM protein 1